MSIQEHLNKIRNAIYGREVRESIAKGIETAYDDASEKDNANMEVKIARGTHPNLRSRLEEVDNKQQQTTAQLAHKANDHEVVKKGSGTLSDFDEATRATLQGLESGQINAVLGTDNVRTGNLADETVTLEKTAFSKKSTNLFDDEESVNGYYVDTTNGELAIGSQTQWASGYVPVGGNSSYYIKSVNRIAYYNSERVFLTGTTIAGNGGIEITTPDEARYVRFTWTATQLTGLQQMNKGSQLLPYEPFYNHIDSDYLPVEKVNIMDTTFYKAGGKNLLDPSWFTVIGYILLESNGEPSQNENFISTDFISVDELPLFREELTASGLSRLNYYDENKNFIETQLGLSQLTPPQSARFVRISVTETNLGTTAQIEKGTSRSSYEDYKPVIDEKYLNIEGQDETAPAIIGDPSRLPTATELSLAVENARKKVPNVDTPLNIPSYDGSGDVTHPSVLYFKESWNGYKFWMAMTPYHNSQGIYENPSILASNDNVTWDEPSTNPVAPLESGESYNSDPDLVMVGDTMELWYRSTTHRDEPRQHRYSVMWRKTSTDGVNWTEREFMFEAENLDTGELVSPTLEYKDGKYSMWAVFKDGTPVIRYGESTDGKSWNWTTLNVPQPKDGDKVYTFWHGDVIRHADGRVEIVMMCQNTEPHSWAVFYTMSLNNKDFIEPTLIMQTSYPTFTRSEKGWDATELYRPTTVIVDDEYYVYYSTPARIGLTKGKSLLTLGLGEDKFSEFPPMNDVHVKMAEQNGFTPTDTLDKYPVESVVYFAAWHQESVGWPETSGVVKTVRIHEESTRGLQYFYPHGNVDYYLMRRANDNGWLEWNKYQGSSV